MPSIIKLEALSGVQDDGPLCYLLQVDHVYFLLDCGWDESFDMAYIDALRARLPQVNAVLVTYGDVPHIGALPYLVAHCGLSCPVYATVPVYKMGQLFLYDWLSGHIAVEDFTHFTFDHIDAAFERVQQVKYSQTILLKGDNGLQITPLPAGHMMGGALWRITKMGEEEIVYAVDFNHKRERHLNGCTFDGIGRPNLLITDAFNILHEQQKHMQRDENLINKLLNTLREGGDVIDTAGRVLEIAHLLDQLWQNKEAGLMTYNLVMLNNVASSVIESAKSMVEWMSEKILRVFELSRHNPFHFRFVKYCHSFQDLVRVRSPKVVLASGLEMESGFSRELFLEWCTDPKNLVIVTGRTGERTLGSRLIRLAEARDQKRSTSNAVTLEVKRRIRLDGAELEIYKAQKREKAKAEARCRLEAVRRNARFERTESSDDSDDDEGAIAAVAAVVAAGKKGRQQPSQHSTSFMDQQSVSDVNKINTQFGFTPMLTSPNRTNFNAHDEFNIASATTIAPAAVANTDVETNTKYDIMRMFEQTQRINFFKQNKKQFPMFPYVEEKSRWDDYGEIIRPKEYVIPDAVVPQLDRLASKHQTLASVKRQLSIKDEADGSAGADKGDNNEPDLPPPPEEWPTKCISEIKKFEVLCKVEFIDFEGRSDGESIRKILAHRIKPKNLLIVHGSAAATRQLADFCLQNNVVQGKIFTPVLGEIVDATIESHIFQVTLSDQLMSSLDFQTVRDAELSWLDARLIRKAQLLPTATAAAMEQQDELLPMDSLIKATIMEKDEDMEMVVDKVDQDNEEDSSKAKDAQKTTTSNNNDMMDTTEAEDSVKNKLPIVAQHLSVVTVPDLLCLELLPTAQIPPHQPVFVNDPKLTDLKLCLTRSGFHAEFASGVLYVDNVASVRRNKAGSFHVEGYACENYFRVREIIYQQFAII